MQLVRIIYGTRNAIDIGNETFEPAVSIYTSQNEIKRKIRPISRWIWEIAETARG